MWSLACSRWFNVTSFMGDIFAKQLAHDGIVDQQHPICTFFMPAIRLIDTRCDSLRVIT